MVQSESDKAVKNGPRLANRIARVLFVVGAAKAVRPGGDGMMVLLHGFIKKDRKTPKPDLDLAKDRLKRMRGSK